MNKPLVKVVWIDAQDHSDPWVHEDEVTAFGARDCPIVSVGFMVSKTNKYITLGADWDAEDSNYGRVTKVPISWVQSITELSESEKLLS